MTTRYWVDERTRKSHATTELRAMYLIAHENVQHLIFNSTRGIQASDVAHNSQLTVLSPTFSLKKDHKSRHSFTHSAMPTARVIIMHNVGQYVCLPWMLLLNFALFQYLTTIYFKRRRETRVALLIACAFLSFFSLTVFSYPDLKFVRNMNNISEVSSVITFLLQITIICRDVSRRVKVRSLRLMMYSAELLVVLQLGIVVFNIVESCFARHKLNSLGRLDLIIQNTSLAFVFFFRFHYSSLNSKDGWRGLWSTRKVEIVLYLLLVTHEYPFMVLDHATGLEWEFVEGLYMRVLIVACLSLTLCEKIRSSNTRRASNDSVGVVAKRHPQILPSAPHASQIPVIDLPSALRTAKTLNGQLLVGECGCR